MPIDILMPALSPTMEEGTLAKWFIKPGDNVSAGDIIAEIETDKATMEVEAVDDGVVGTLKIAAGTEGVKVNSIIAILIGEDENFDPGNLPANTDKAPAEASKATTGQADENKGKASQSLSQPAAGAPPNGRPAKNQPEQNNPPQPSVGKASEQKQGRVFASPLAKRLAAQFGLSLESVQGSGPRGRIIKRDVEQASAAGTGAASPSPALPIGTSPTGTSPASSLPQNLELKPDDAAILRSFEPGSYELLAHDGMRKTIAKRLSAAKRDIPHFYIQTDCRIDALLDMRAQINAGAPKSASGDAAYKISVNDLVIKAHALALSQVPKANASYTETAAVYHKYCDIGVAVAVEGGLFTPIIRRAEEKSLSAISNEMRELAQKARTRKLKPHEYEGGGTAISNLGMYGIDAFSAVINPPHGTILAVGAGVKKPVVEGDQIVAGTIMSATLSVDHRVVDGTLGAELLAAFKRLIENPLTMLI